MSSEKKHMRTKKEQNENRERREKIKLVKVVKLPPKRDVFCQKCVEKILKYYDFF